MLLETEDEMHTACGEMGNAHKTLVGKPEERDHSENLSIDNNNKKWVFEA
jgi:hypothetical protein